LYERIAYDDAAQPLTATFMDYTIPTAIEVPNIELGHQETPTPFTRSGRKASASRASERRSARSAAQSRTRCRSSTWS